MEREEWWLLVPHPLREFPADLSFVVTWILLTDLAVLGGVGIDDRWRVVLGFPFVLFLPGYVVTAALFPERGVIGGVERLVLSIGLSIAAVPMVGLALNFSPWGIRLTPVVLALSVGELVVVGIAANRRSALPDGERFVVPVSGWLRRRYRSIVGGAPRGDRAAEAALAVMVLVAFVGLGIAIASSQNGERFTELSVLSRGPTGDLVAEGYPTELSPGQEGEVIVVVGNHEGEPVTYTVVVVTEPLLPSERLGAPAEIDRFDVSVRAGENRRLTHTFVPTTDGSRQRLSYLLYRGSPPAEPTRQNAYRAVHLWITVTG